MANILVVEDNEVNLRLVRFVLESAGHGVTHAATGDDGVRMARESMPDLVLIDIQLPGMDGLAATRLLKQDPATARIPVIALTAHAMKGDEDRIREAGCDGYLAKPFHYPDLLKAIDEILARK
jgi:two-component system cell cycle response regulator DivK